MQTKLSEKSDNFDLATYCLKHEPRSIMPRWPFFFVQIHTSQNHVRFRPQYSEKARAICRDLQLNIQH
jgi:hypothetical protein